MIPQRVVVISNVLRDGDKLLVRSLAEPDSNEAQIIQRFYDGIEKFTLQLISWNGGGFDLPVLHYHGLIHGAITSEQHDAEIAFVRAQLAALNKPHWNAFLAEG